METLLTSPERRALLERLTALRTRARVQLALDGLGSLALALVSAGLISFGIDRVFRLPQGQRAVVLGVALAVLAALLWRRVLARLRAPLPLAELARQVERVHPSFDWRLVSAVQFLENQDPRGSHELAELVVDQAVAAARGVEFGSALDTGAVAKRWASGGLVLAAGIALVAGFPNAARTWFERCVLLSATAEWPRDTHLWVEPFGEKREILIPRGSDLAVVVSATGVVPSRASLAFEFPRTQLRGTRVLVPAGRARFRHLFEKVGEDLEITVRGGDDEVGPLKVTVVNPPWLERIEVESTPPAYTKVPPRKFGMEAGETALPAGSLVTVRATCSKKLREARLEVRFAGARLDAPPEVVAAKVITAKDALVGDSLEASLVLDRTAAIAIQVKDRDDLALERDVSLTLRAIPDAAPKVQLALHGIGTLCTPDAVLPLELHAEDDYGLFAAELRYRATNPKGKADEGALPVPVEALPRTITQPLEWDLAQLEKKLTPGTFFSFTAQATDDDPKGRKSSDSSGFALRVVTGEELLLDLIRRQHEQRRELEKLREDEDKLVPLLDNLDTVAEERAPKQQRAAVKVAADAVRGLTQVVDEMKNNRLLDERARARLTEDVVNPLEALRAGELTHARDLAEGLAGHADDAARAQRSHETAQSVRVCVAELDRIIAQMKRVADLAELVAKVREILKRERDLMDETKKSSGD